ncbi:outer membrane protein transport protein (OMPP1/FadL/TodX) [Flavobacterium limicola]|uniref:Outer membrane protein transport protein (OMPP1/FadL/TodX) n=1 Tax=Flavobacterium limicola TaxID=180441 RepID=A0A495RZQ7_9FLAO|nr:outer membrane protein transport protein [Flavobacterium limicola]RKS92378.1 outer membrane protein transport protein (OMPP1/FadL/TodX) [Flavobacterium limicola]
MKKYIFLFALGLTISVAQSQEISDAMRYSQDNLNGTARFRAMSGAFGALGGDLSSLNVNPAGSAVFSNNQMTVTLSNFDTKNKSNYFGTATTEKENTFDLNQAGAVFVFNDKNPNSDWKKFSLAINYENTNNFDNALFSAGTNPNNSIDQYFLSYANTGNNGAPVPQQFVNREIGESISDLYSFLGSNLPNNQYPKLNGFAAQQAMIAFYNQGFIIDAADINDPNSPYITNVPAGGNYYQENSVYSTGYNGKLSFNAATSYKDKLFIGLNLNSHFTDYQKSSSFYEDNNAPLTSEYTVSRLRFDNDLYTYGTGFSFQVGAIAKLTNEVRLGLAYESATWYRLTDELSQSLFAVSANTSGELQPDDVDPQVINIYEPYKLQTPSKLTGSFAYVFGKSGLISIDYAMKNYSNTKFKSENEFTGINNEIGSILDTSGELRIGAEYKIEALSLRAGYRYEQSPYKNKVTIGDLTGYSAGLGYSFGSTKVDLAYSYAKRNSQQGFFGQGFTDGAKIDAINNNVSLTLAFEL